MKRYLKSSIVATLLFVQIFLLSCIQANREFGSEMLPPGQMMTTLIDSFTVVPRTYIYSVDSIETSRTNAKDKAIGSLYDPITGRTDVQVFANYTPIGFNYGETKFFGENAVLDSMFLVLAFTGYKGDTVRGLDLEVYEVLKGSSYKPYKRYFSNRDMTPYLNDTALIKFKVNSPNVHIKRLPIQFARKYFITNQDNKNPYYSDTVFQEMFRGLYFKTNTTQAPQEGCMYNLDLGASSMMLFYHNKNSDGKKDTLKLNYVMFSSIAAYNNTNFVTVQHDYKLADPANGGVKTQEINDSTISTKLGYISAPAGLGTVVEFPKEGIEKMKLKAKSMGYKTVAIHSAVLEFDVENPVWQNYDKMFTQIGAYFSFANFSYIPDYRPNLTPELNLMGGELSRSLGKYKFNLTSYIQGLFTGKYAKHKLDMGPAIKLYLAPSRSVLKGSASENPPKLIITYTLIK